MRSIAFLIIAQICLFVVPCRQIGCVILAASGSHEKIQKSSAIINEAPINRIDKIKGDTEKIISRDKKKKSVKTVTGDVKKNAVKKQPRPNTAQKENNHNIDDNTNSSDTINKKNIISDEKVKGENKDKPQNNATKKTGRKDKTGEKKEKKINANKADIKEKHSSENLNKDEIEIKSVDKKKKEKPRKVKKAKKKKGRNVEDLYPRYAALIIGYGGYFPVSEYGSLYQPSQLVSVSVPLFFFRLWKISPEINFRYSQMRGKKASLRYNSEMTSVQFFPSLLLRHVFYLSKSKGVFLNLDFRIFDGLNKIEFESWNNINPILGKVKIVDYINMFGFSGGVSCRIFRGFFLGFDIGYSVTFTKGSPLQTLSCMVKGGYQF